MAWYPFNGTANDSSGNSNHGTVHGATLTTDRFGNLNSAYSFDGTDDYISCLQPGPLGTSPRTITFWGKTDAAAKAVQSNAVLSYGASAGSGNYGDRLEINLNSGANGLTLTVGGAYLTKSFDNTDADWHHYAIVFEGGTDKKMSDFKLYADGQLLTTTAGSVDHGHTINTTGQYNLHIGQLHAYGRFFKGELDDIRIYSRALTDIEIKSSSLDLIAFYPFNGNANDSSGYGHHGTVNGATLAADRHGNPNRAYEFDGVNDVISIPHSSILNADSELSVSVWVKPASFPSSGSAMILGKSNYSNKTNYLLRIKPNGYLQFEYKTFANTSDNPLHLNQWNHIVVTASSTDVKKVYVNNVLATHTTANSPYGLVTNTLTIGAAGYSSEYYKGSIDDLRIYKTELMVSDVNHLFNNITTQIKPNTKNSNSCHIVNNTLFFNDTQNLNEIKRISIYDVSGRRVFSTNYITESIELNNLRKGIYFLTVEKNESPISTLKFMIR